MKTIDGDDDSYDDIVKGWCKIWRNDAGKFHRDGGLPALIYISGAMFYFKNGQPAVFLYW